MMKEKQSRNKRCERVLINIILDIFSQFINQVDLYICQYYPIWSCLCGNTCKAKNVIHDVESHKEKFGGG